MIEKITPEHIIGLDGLQTTIMPDSAKLMRKLNELVDAVNELQLTVSKMENLEHLKKIGQGFKNLQDPYAEQRKWIGTLCRCWDSDINDDIWGILQDIKDNKTEKYYLYGIGYEHCEPVKPDDDIIYKGE